MPDNLFNKVAALKKETLAQMLSCENNEICEDLFYRTPLGDCLSEYAALVKSNTFSGKMGSTIITVMPTIQNTSNIPGGGLLKRNMDPNH